MSKLSILSFFLFLSLPSFGNDPVRGCLEIDNAYKSQCASVLSRGYYLSSYVLKACQAIRKSQTQIRCLKGALNKKYTESIVSICTEERFDSGIRDCIINSGKFIKESDVKKETEKSHEKKIQNIKALVEKAKEDIEEDENSNLISTLDKILEIVSKD